MATGVGVGVGIGADRPGGVVAVAAVSTTAAPARALVGNLMAFRRRVTRERRAWRQAPGRPISMANGSKPTDLRNGPV